jgi:hypothetical protein
MTDSALTAPLSELHVYSSVVDDQPGAELGADQLYSVDDQLQSRSLRRDGQTLVIHADRRQPQLVATGGLYLGGRQVAIR